MQLLREGWGRVIQGAAEHARAERSGVYPQHLIQACGPLRPQGLQDMLASDISQQWLRQSADCRSGDVTRTQMLALGGWDFHGD